MRVRVRSRSSWIGAGGTKLLGISPCANRSASTSVNEASSSRTCHTGFQYTPVASIATCVQPASVSQAASSSRPAVVVANSRCSVVTFRPAAMRAHAFTHREWTSSPAHRGYKTSMRHLLYREVLAWSPPVRNLEDALPGRSGVAIRGARGTPGQTTKRALGTIEKPTSVPASRPTQYTCFIDAWVRRRRVGNYEEVPIDDTRRVAVITVTQGATKPYVVRYRGREDIYVRVGSTSRLASREQQARLFAVGGLIHTELLPVSGSGLRDLSRDRLADYLTAIVGDRDAPATDDAWHARLCALGFMVEREDGPPACTIAGLVLFGYRPRRLLRHAGRPLDLLQGRRKSLRRPRRPGCSKGRSSISGACCREAVSGWRKVSSNVLPIRCGHSCPRRPATWTNPCAGNGVGTTRWTRFARASSTR